MLPSSRDVLLKLYETKSPQKLFPFNDHTVYIEFPGIRFSGRPNGSGLKTYKTIQKHKR